MKPFEGIWLLPNGKSACRHCDGDGIDPLDRVSVLATPCPFCEGNGEHPDFDAEIDEPRPTFYPHTCPNATRCYLNKKRKIMNEKWQGSLTRKQAIQIVDRMTDQDDPAWEFATEDYYDEETDTGPTIKDVFAALGVSEEEYESATT